MIAIDLTELNPFPPPGPTVTFTGYLAAGGTVTQSFTLDGLAFEPETFVFPPSFRDVVAVEFAPAAPTTAQAFQYDNIFVPEPSPTLLTAAGVALVARLGWRGRRRRGAKTRRSRKTG
jgi:hypothetical protein